MGIVLVVELFRLLPDAVSDRLADGRMVVEGFGNIGRGDAELFGQVIDRRSFSAVHGSLFNIEIMLNLRNKS